jgi:hypothetical protein
MHSLRCRGFLMRSGRRASGRSRSADVIPKPGIFGVDQLVGGAVEDNFAFVEDEKFCVFVDTLVGDRLDLAGFGVEAAPREKECVLQTVGDQQ